MTSSARMDSIRDSRFDPNHAVEILLDIAHEQSLDRLLKKLVQRAVERPNIACVQVWLIQPGDLCPACPWRADCPDKSRCLHLVASQGTTAVPAEAKEPKADPRYVRMPLGKGILGNAVVTGEQIMRANLDQATADTTGFGWLKHTPIRSCGVTPIIFKHDILGATVAFTPETLPDEAQPWGRIFADHLGAAIANARAFEEIRRLQTQLELQNAYLQEAVVEAKAFGALVGQSEVLRQMISQIDLVAPTEAAVLILGETGTGKDLVAHEIHRRSSRKDGPLVRVNCAAIPQELFESELFGHVKGAFTGATKDRAGRFETAAGGTLFLDEIGEVSLEMQSKLLRVLQEKHYERVGDDRTRKADVRIVAATNRDLKSAVADGRFREDLFYRLHVFPIQVAPLREHKADIPLLARHFVDLSVRELRCPPPRLSEAVITSLMNYAWPGNIRELRNVIERAVILARGGPLQVHLPQSVPPVRLPPAPPGPGSESRGEIFTEAEMRRRERENLLAALHQTGWKIKGSDGAAALLGLKATTLLARMKKMNLVRSA